MIIKNMMRSQLNDDWGILDLQNCILNITQYIHNFCEENGIEYCIMGGTALGAVRHGGFIPWDDDVDLFMTPDNYIKFRKLFNEKGDKSNFYLQELGRSGEFVGFAKLRLNNSTYIEELAEEWDMHRGIFVDIMILHNYPNKRLSRLWMLFWVNYLYLKSAANMNYMGRGILINFLLKPIKFLPKRFLLAYGLKQIWKYKDEECDNYFHYYMSMPLSHSIYPRYLFNKMNLVSFETTHLRLLSGVKQYLTILYGDYMKVPNIRKIQREQHAVRWSIDTPFEKHGNGTFEDEKYRW